MTYEANQKKLGPKKYPVPHGSGGADATHLRLMAKKARRRERRVKVWTDTWTKLSESFYATEKKLSMIDPENDPEQHAEWTEHHRIAGKKFDAHNEFLRSCNLNLS